MIEHDAKHRRLLAFCIRLLSGEVLYKQKEAERYDRSARSIQRDLRDLQAFFTEFYENQGEITPKITYSKNLKGHVMSYGKNAHLTQEEILAVCKVLLASRAFTKGEMTDIIDKMIAHNINRGMSKDLARLLQNERYYYRPTHESKEGIDLLWKLGEAIGKQEVMSITYKRLDGQLVERQIQPLGIMFAEFYFYLLAYIEDKEGIVRPCDGPVVYRLDRLQKLKKVGRTFRVEHTSKFKENEFRDRIQFMHSGSLQRIKFRYTGYALDVVLDRFPGASWKEESRAEDGKVSCLVEAEVFGYGYEMWLRAQGEQVQLLSPKESVEKFVKKLKNIVDLYTV